MGVMSLSEALRVASDMDVDLVEISATANPPVCRLIDYGKFKYQEQKREQETKAKQTVIEVKEIKLRPGTDEGARPHQVADQPVVRVEPADGVRRGGDEPGPAHRLGRLQRGTGRVPRASGARVQGLVTTARPAGLRIRRTPGRRARRQPG